MKLLSMALEFNTASYDVVVFAFGQDFADVSFGQDLEIRSVKDR